ncbi:MAG: glycosyltransferase [Leptolyngbya sp. PLA1]|nr:glycosyltransferase [Leptolyngbya sp. PLA1]
MPHRIPMLIALPGGLIAGGVATWAVRLANGLAGRGRDVGLIVHARTGEHAPLRLAVDPRVRLTDLTGFSPLERAEGRLPELLDAYEHAARELAPRGPVVLCPSQHGDCFGLAAGLTQRRADVRVLGWLHNDLPYEYHVQARYECAISKFAGVSERLASGLRSMLPAREADIVRLTHGVDVPDLPVRPMCDGRPLRLVYAGRLDEPQKRVSALLEMSRVLDSQGVRHELVLVGDGPAAARVRACASALPSVTVLPPLVNERVLALFGAADMTVLASRHEGLSLSVLEAISRGCVPVITRTDSGAAELVEDGVSGVLVDASVDADDACVGSAMASGVRRAAADLGALSRGAHARARSSFSTRVQLDAVESLVDSAPSWPARAWPRARDWAFSGGGGGASGAVPEDGPARLARVLGALSGQAVVVHGTGRHTIEMEEVFRAAPCRIVAFADDDPARQGGTLWGVPVRSAEAAAASGATDVVISSAINQQQIWRRRGVYERAGLRVHRLYEDWAPRA